MVEGEERVLYIFCHYIVPRRLGLTPLSSFSVWGLLLWHALGFLTLGAVSNPSSVQSLSHVRLFVTPWTVARQASLSITNSWSLLKLMSMESVMPSNHFILCRPLRLLPQSFPASGSISMSQFFASGGQSVGVSASASVLPMNIQDWFHSGLTGLISLLIKLCYFHIIKTFKNDVVKECLLT